MGPSPTQPTFVYNNIMSQYSSLGELSVARYLFDKMPHRNVVSYNIIISGYSRCGYVGEAWKIFSVMRVCGFEPTQYAVGGFLTCRSLDVYHGVQLHSLVIKNGLFDVDAFVGTCLLGFYGRHGLLEEAVWAFEDMPLLSCQQDFEFGEQLHALVIKNGFKCEVAVLNSLISMYMKCTGIFLAEKIIEEVTFLDVVSWNTMIGAVAKTDRPQKALEFFTKMSMDGVLPTETTFVSLINCCTHLEIPFYGESFHVKIIQHGLESNVFVGSALVDFYAKCDNLESARRCFNEIYVKNVVCWNALILGYSNNYSPASIVLLQEMLHLGYRPNEFSFSAALKSSLALELQQLHCLIVRMGFQKHDSV
ncbi:hypothetical protein L3X38_026963 [Prunus dulcis]|uniref:Pentatricopeptide repeat-containing protein n=1 Tax=Prunus dulcis TaxID=3755 RepID=A0AAD4VNU4_PRUDU|nr:hypothetical protein L3X38_026963 [Prunus dulcis]